MCHCKKRRPKRTLGDINFPVPFPSEELYKKKPSKWSKEDVVNVALWLIECGEETGSEILPAPLKSWAREQVASMHGDDEGEAKEGDSD